MEYVNEVGWWNWPAFESFLSEEVLNMLAIMLPPSDLEENDSVFWSLTRNGRFTVKSAYEMNSGDGINSNLDWRMV